MTARDVAVRTAADRLTALAAQHLPEHARADFAEVLGLLRDDTRRAWSGTLLAATDRLYAASFPAQPRSSGVDQSLRAKVAAGLVATARCALGWETPEELARVLARLDLPPELPPATPPAPSGWWVHFRDGRARELSTRATGDGWVRAELPGVDGAWCLAPDALNAITGLFAKLARDVGAVALVAPGVELDGRS